MNILNRLRKIIFGSTETAVPAISFDPPLLKVVVLHEGYGCETGCCLHVVRINDESGKELGHSGFFDHPELATSEAKRAYAIELAKEAVEREYGPDHTFDLDWTNCNVVAEENDGCWN